LKPASLSFPFAVTALLSAAVFAVAALAQAPQPAPPTAGTPPPAHHMHPAPTNLKVLPKELTGDQLDEIMDQWAGALGAHCNTCHTADPTNIGPNGKPRLKYADDSKPEKATARQMYTMLEEINVKYVSKIDSSGAPVTCGTCHRGHLGPEPFVAPVKEGHGAPQGPPAATAPALK